MIKGLHEDSLLGMVGTFYSQFFGYDITVIYDKEISQEYVEKNIQYLNNLGQEFQSQLYAALKRFYLDYEEILPDICEDIDGNILEEFENDPKSILKYIKISVYMFHKYSVENEEIFVLNLRGSCEWSGDEGLTIAAKNNQLIYVGPWEDIDIWIENGRESMFNYAFS